MHTFHDESQQFMQFSMRTQFTGGRRNIQHVEENFNTLTVTVAAGENIIFLSRCNVCSNKNCELVLVENELGLKGLVPGDLIEWKSVPFVCGLRTQCQNLTFPREDAFLEHVIESHFFNQIDKAIPKRTLQCPFNNCNFKAQYRKELVLHYGGMPFRNYAKHHIAQNLMLKAYFETKRSQQNSTQERNKNKSTSTLKNRSFQVDLLSGHLTNINVSNAAQDTTVQQNINSANNRSESNGEHEKNERGRQVNLNLEKGIDFSEQPQTKEMENYRIKIIQLQEDIVKLKGVNEKLGSEISNAKGSVSEFAGKLVQQSNDNVMLKEKIAKIVQNIAQIKEELQTEKCNHAETAKELQTERIYSQSLRDRLLQEEEKLRHSKVDFSKVNHSLNDANERVQNQNEKIEKLEQGKLDLLDQLSVVTKKKEYYKARVDQLLVKLSDKQETSVINQDRNQEMEILKDLLQQTENEASLSAEKMKEMQTQLQLYQDEIIIIKSQVEVPENEEEKVKNLKSELKSWKDIASTYESMARGDQDIELKLVDVPEMTIKDEKIQYLENKVRMNRKLAFQYKDLIKNSHEDLVEKQSKVIKSEPVQIVIKTESRSRRQSSDCFQENESLNRSKSLDSSYELMQSSAEKANKSSRSKRTSSSSSHSHSEHSDKKLKRNPKDSQ